MLWVLLNVFSSKFLFAVVTFLGWILILAKIVKIYFASVVCPRCHNIYNLSKNTGIRVPFAKRCLSCGLPLGRK